MKIVYGKELSQEEAVLASNIALECGISYDTARLLLYRNINSVEKAKVFLSPGKSHFINPFLLSGMREAVEKIKIAKQKGYNVLIFGDYDADGISASCILYNCLSDFGIKATTVIPEREDGYGFNVQKIMQLNSQKHIDLIISVDCGISEKEHIDQLKKEGIDVIVTDHHEPPEELPDCITVNPKLEGQQYSFNGLCGAGVAYKLGYALIGKKADNYLDFVALATVADSMELVGENRDLVVEGLKIFNSVHIRKSFKYLLGENTRKITAQTLAYSVAPRINAGGRMGDANCALKLFTSDNEEEMFNLAVKLNGYNLSRQTECDKVYASAKQKIKDSLAYLDDIILVYDESWATGLIGIVAAKLVEDFNRPVIVFGGQDGSLKGSARSTDNINIHEAISSCKEYTLTFGGHAQAAGISIKEENFELMRKMLNDYVKSNCLQPIAEKEIYAEWNIRGAFPIELAKEVDMLEPFGQGNKKPLFTTTIGSVKALPLKEDSPHYSFTTDVLEMLDFNGEDHVRTLALPTSKTILFETNLSVYKGRESLKGYLKGIYTEYSDLNGLKPYAVYNELYKLIDEKAVNTTAISVENVKFESGLGTLYALSDVENFTYYKDKCKLKISLYKPQNSGTENCVVVTPEIIPDGYDKVVYLDKPLSFLPTGGRSYVVENLKGFKVLDKINVDRNSMATTFNILKGLTGSYFTDFVALYNEKMVEEEIYNFLFGAVVFTELGFFTVKKGRLYFNKDVKNPLTNSNVYSKICLMKG